MTSGFALSHLKFAWSSEEMGGEQRKERREKGERRGTERNSGLALVHLNSNC